MTLYKGILDMIGNTPLIELCAIKQKYLLHGDIYAKVKVLILLVQ